MKRSLTTLCPSCGAQVGFVAGDSVLVVCGYCRSTLLRSGEALENLGRMAELFEDHSPLQLGTSGTADGRGFTLIGRLQVRYPGGTWNEWRALYADGTAGWLSEDNGHFVLLDDGLAPDVAEAVAREARWPAFDALKPDLVFVVGGIVWRVVNKEAATVIAGEGELPYRIGAGVPVRVADLRGPAGQFATLDYPLSAGQAADAVPTFYRGKAVRLIDLGLAGLRTELTRRVATEAFACPSCGAPVSVRLPTTRSLACPSCAVVIDISQGTGARIASWRQKGKAVKPLLPLQSGGRFEGVNWTVVGFQRRQSRVDGEVFHWDEYLLHEPMRGFRFLVDDRGHWSWVEVLQRSITRSRDARNRGVVQFDGQRFDQYAGYTSQASWILGEFYWRLEAGDRSRHEDYIAPPRMLSCEMTDNEITWSQGRYLTPAEVAEAFGLKKPLPPPAGLGTIQPAGERWRRAYVAMAAAVLLGLLLLQAVLWVGGTDRELAGVQTVRAGDSAFQDTLVDVAGTRASNLVIRVAAPLSNQAVEVDVEVAARAGDPAGGGTDGQRRWSSQTELAYFSGRGSDGDWQEGSKDQRLVFKLPAGPYLVRVRAGMVQPATPGAGLPVSYSIAQRSRPTWLPFFVALLVLGILNLIAILGSPDPEQLRWADSDYGTRPGRPTQT